MTQFSSDIKYPWLRKFLLVIFLSYMTYMLGPKIAWGGFGVPVILVCIPIGLAVIYLIFSHPKNGLLTCLVAAFILNGLGRYVSFPFGLTLDILLLLTLLITIFFYFIF